MCKIVTIFRLKKILFTNVANDIETYCSFLKEGTNKH